MRTIAILGVVLLALPMIACAVSLSSTPDTKPAGVARPDLPDGREGGETMADAVLIPSFPYSDTGSTVGHVNDYDEMCPYGGINAPDVVYKIIPTTDLCIDVDLCASLYDTKVYIFQDVVQNTIACNDDAGCGYSGWQSRLDDVHLPSGHTFYVIVDGYGDSAGTYVMTITEGPECVLECPPGALIEQEPWCYEGYIDNSNGGCQYYPFLFDDIAPAAPGETVVLCGTGGTFLYNGSSYRDCDWFQLTLDEEQTVQFCCQAEFPLLIVFIYVADCAIPQYEYAQGDICESVCISRTVGPGVAWLWVGTSVFQGVPCGSDYIMTIDGYCAPSPVEARSWGMVKAMYR